LQLRSGIRSESARCGVKELTGSFALT
jgi:hypothetical protein